MTAQADHISREIEQAAQDVLRIQALSRSQPHIFAEQKHEAFKRLQKLAAEVRNTFGGPASQFRAGTVVARGREVRVERRRRAA